MGLMLPHRTTIYTIRLNLPSTQPRTPPAISQSHLQRQVNELILVRVAGCGEGLEDLREKKER